MHVSVSDFQRILRCASEAGISDIHISAGEPVFWRRGEVLSPLNQYVPTEKDLYEFFKSYVDARGLEEMYEQKYSNTALEMGEWRYRLHSYRKGGRVSLAVRTLPRQIPELVALGQAELVGQFLRYRHGLLLVTGATGAGKSTTVASFLQELNRRENMHILTLEDPVEFKLESDQCLISQLEKAVDFDNYGVAVENAMREAPDVIMLSEMRDTATVQAVMNAAVSGHYVIATMHAGGVVEAVERIVSMYPEGQQAMARSMLSTSLVGICSQILLPGKNGLRQCAMECLHVNHAARNVIRSGKYEQLQNIMQSGAKEGMQTMEMAVEALQAERLIKSGQTAAHPSLNAG